MAHALRFDPHETSDEALIARIESGDRQAFDVIYERYFGRVYGFVSRRLSNRADTEDTVQEVFFSVFSSLASYRREAPLPAWILGIARRVVASRFKKKRHPTISLNAETEPETIDLFMPLLQRAATPLEHYECRERIGQLESAAARKLTQEQLQLFELHHLRHRSITDIASILHKSEDSVKSNLYRARKVLLTR
ncbi:MAG: sigma-70 family RNA polymerase sigma factor [Myxococcales bacterium]|nr:sigma-70 family RNA polymerase sigma factor [Myxococcales bacterium]